MVAKIGVGRSENELTNAFKPNTEFCKKKRSILIKVLRSKICAKVLRELSNEYLLAKIGFDTAGNEPYQVCPLKASTSFA